MQRANQLEIFDRITLNISTSFTEALAEDARSCGLSREQIVDRMNDLADRYGVVMTHGNGRRLTIDIFEKWLNPSEMSRVMPVKAIPIFCAAVGRHSALNIIAEPIGFRVIGDREKKLLAWAEAKMTIREQTRTIKKIEGELI